MVGGGEGSCAEWGTTVNRLRCPRLRTRSSTSLRPGVRGQALSAHKCLWPDGPGQGLCSSRCRESCASPGLSGQTWAAAQALNPHAGRPPAPAQPGHPPPVFSDGALPSVLLPTWFLLSGRAGALPAPATSPAGCDSWRLWRPDLLLPRDGTIKLSSQQGRCKWTQEAGFHGCHLSPCPPCQPSVCRAEHSNSTVRCAFYFLLSKS